MPNRRCRVDDPSESLRQGGEAEAVCALGNVSQVRSTAIDVLNLALCESLHSHGQAQPDSDLASTSHDSMSTRDAEIDARSDSGNCAATTKSHLVRDGGICRKRLHREHDALTLKAELPPNVRSGCHFCHLHARRE
jgi:hypothetical protein